jgi:hypothetical protein
VRMRGCWGFCRCLEGREIAESLPRESPSNCRYTLQNANTNFRSDEAPLAIAVAQEDDSMAISHGSHKEVGPLPIGHFC